MIMADILKIFLSILGGRGAEAVDFYAEAFGAQPVERNVAQDGKSQPTW